MTREEAIKVCTREKECVQSALDVCADGGHYVSPDGIITAMDYVEAMTMAISALREQESAENAHCNCCKKGNSWISVEERLPECDQRVLCRYTFGDDGRMYFYQVLDYYATDPQPHFQHTLGDSKMRVTHWMPLPEAPKEEV